MSAFLELVDLQVVRPNFRVEVPFLGIEKGSIHVLQGPSGSGKSTVLLAVAGFENVEKGTVRVGGKDITHFYPEERGVGFVFQQNALFPHLTVLENVSFGLRVRGVSTAERNQKATQWLTRVGLKGLESRKVNQISGGEAQRVQLARALICGFPVLLLDEPFSSLDIELKIDLRKLVKELIKETGVAALLVTHDPEDISWLADQVSYMENGKIIRSEKVQSV